MTTQKAFEMLHQKMKEKGLKPEHPEKFKKAMNAFTDEKQIIIKRLENIENQNALNSIKLDNLINKINEVLETFGMKKEEDD